MVRRFWWLLIPVLAYCLLVLVVALMQRSLMYHPPHLTAAELRPFAERNHLQPWTNEAGLRIGWYRAAPRVPAEATVLIVHGNSGSAAGREYIFDPLQAAINADIFVLEYPGFADRPGAPSQQTILAAAGDAFRLLASRGRIVLVGESLGTGVASYLAARAPQQVAGVVLLVPYDNTVNAAQSRFPWLPAGLLIKDRFLSDEWLPQFRGAVVFAVAEKDEVLPAALGKRLYDLYPGPKRLVLCPGAGHMDGAVRPKEFWRDAWGFIRAS